MPNLLLSSQKTSSKLRPTLTPSHAEKLVHASISSRLFYCDSLFTGNTGENIQNLQYIQNSAGGSWWVWKYENMTTILHSLHWLRLIPDWPQSLPTHSSPNLHPLPQIHKRLAPPGSQHQAQHHGPPGILLMERSPWRREGNTDSFKTGLKTFLFRKVFLTVSNNCQLFLKFICIHLLAL